MADILEIQSRLERHFTTLSKQRGKMPVFALEHGLENAEIAVLQDGVRFQSRLSGAPEKQAWLLWIVYAAELGYRYSGGEYWQTFALETPCWNNRSREWIRDRFEWFSTIYNGAQPVGEWAENFGIIAYPIVNAILPRDLQRFLARVLYDIRYAVGELLGEHKLLGERIEQFAGATSDRFRRFVGQHELVGRIATALLLSDNHRDDSLIEPRTLSRIRRSLEEEISSKRFMEAARDSVAAFRSAGIKTPRPNQSALAKPRVAGVFPPSSLRRPPITPRLSLESQGASDWGLVLETPNCDALCEQIPGARVWLENCRPRIQGTKEGYHSRGFLLRCRRLQMTRWPAEGEPFIQFDRPLASIDQVFRNEFRLPNHFPIVFRLENDGCASEIRNRVVRVGGTYLLVDRPPSSAALPVGELQQTSCSGLRVIKCSFPNAAALKAAEQAFEHIGIRIDQWLDIRPFGILPKSWDGQGSGTWRSGEAPTFRISANLPTNCKLMIRLNLPEEKCLEIEPNEFQIAQLPILPRGSFLLEIFSSSTTGEQKFLGNVEIRIEDNEIWDPKAQNDLLSLFLQPAAANLEDVWLGRAAIVGSGLAGLTVMPIVEFLDGRKSPLLTSLGMPVLKLPFSNRIWREAFDKFITSRADAQRAIDSAASIRIQFNTSVMGSRSIVVERPLTRLRWRILKANGSVRAEVIDYRGKQDPEVRLLSCATPATYSAPSVTSSDEGPQVDCSVPAMLLAKADGIAQGLVVVPMPKEGFQLGKLSIRSEVIPPKRELNDIIAFIELIEMWSRAQLQGRTLAAFHRCNVLHALHQSLFASLCGERWGKCELAAEVSRLDSRPFEHFAERLSEGLDYFGSTARLSATLRLDAGEFLDLAPEERVEHLVPFFRPLIPDAGLNSLIEFGFRLASSPESIRTWADGRFGHLLLRTLGNRALLKACRFVVLATNQTAALGGSMVPMSQFPLYEGWKWE